MLTAVKYLNGVTPRVASKNKFTVKCPVYRPEIKNHLTSNELNK